MLYIDSYFAIDTSSISFFFSFVLFCCVFFFIPRKKQIENKTSLEKATIAAHAFWFAFSFWMRLFYCSSFEITNDTNTTTAYKCCRYWIHEFIIKISAHARFPLANGNQAFHLKFCVGVFAQHLQRKWHRI